jgi:hypothetical protein
MIALFAVATQGGCIRANASHCGNNGGHTACGGETPVCNVCEADNDGCVAGPVHDPSCLYDGVAPDSDASTSTSAGSAGSSSTTDPATTDPDGTGTSETTGPPPPQCGDGTVDEAEECEGDMMTDCQSIGAGNGEAPCNATLCVWDTAGCDMQPVCGNNMVEPGELCDGTDLNDQECTDRADQNGAYVGGTLACMDCLFDESDCIPCKTLGLGCQSDSECCSGTCGLFSCGS